MSTHDRIADIIRKIWQSHANPSGLPDEDAIKEMVENIIPEISGISELEATLLNLLDRKGYTTVSLTFNDDESSNYKTVASYAEYMNGPNYRTLSTLENPEFWIGGEKDYHKALDTNTLDFTVVS